MGNYIVSARKYRPDTFSSVVGQGHVTQTLKSAILLDQLAHAFLFSGPRGVGKTTCARILAKAINCQNLREDGEPCNECESCNSYNEGKSINIHELDAASNNSVEDIRNLIEQTRYIPPNGKQSVYIIDEVHMLSQAAFNAFLKTLEEPPKHVLFILATTEKHKILPTILSRCQKFDFRRIKVDDIARHLEFISKAETVNYEYAALQQIALKADGALRDALSLYDQLVSYSGNELTFQTVLRNLNILDYDYYFRTIRLIQQQDHSEVLLLLNEIIEQGFEAKDFIVGLTEHFRNLLVCQDPKTVQLLEASENVKARYLEQSKEIEPTFLLNAFHLCSEAENKTKLASHIRLTVELALIKLSYLQTAVQVAADPDSAATIVKKKRIAEPPQNGTNKPDGVQSVPTQKITSPPLEEKIPKAEVKEISPLSQTTPTVVAESSISEPLPKRISTQKRQRKPSFKLRDNLNEMVVEIEQNKDLNADNQAATDETTVYEINPDIQVDQAVFEAAFAEYLHKLSEQNSMNLMAILQNGTSTWEHNKWMLAVESELSRNLLEREKEIIPFMREKLNVPELFWELSINPELQSKQQNIPYSDEGKLKEMVNKNPALRRLQEIFKTRIIYS